MQQAEVPTPVGFADSTLKSYARIDEIVSVHLHLWNDQKARIDFYGVLGVRDLGVGDVSNLLEATEYQGFLQECIEYAFEKPPELGLYRLYLFLNLNGNPSLQLVAKECKIHIEPIGQ